VNTRQVERLSRQLEKARGLTPDIRKLERVSRTFAKPAIAAPLQKHRDLAEIVEPFRKQLAEMAELPRLDAWDFRSELHWDPVPHESTAVARLERMLEYAREQAEYAARAEERAQLAEARAERAESRERRRDRFMIGSLIIGVIGAAGTVYTVLVAVL
jgi:hypothetical protein